MGHVDLMANPTGHEGSMYLGMDDGTAFQGFGTFEGTGISSEEFLSIVDQMEGWDIYF